MVRGILPRCSKKSFVGSSLRSPNSWGRPVASLHPPRSLYCSSLCKNKFGFTSVYEPVWTSSLLRTFCFSKFYCADFFASFTLRQLWILKVIIPRMSRKFTGFVISWKNIKYSLFSRNGVRVWNNLSNEIRQMPKVKFKRNIHNMLLQKLSEANEYIDLLDLNMSWKLNSVHSISFLSTLSFQLPM